MQLLLLGPEHTVITCYQTQVFELYPSFFLSKLMADDNSTITRPVLRESASLTRLRAPAGGVTTPPSPTTSEKNSPIIGGVDMVDTPLDQPSSPVLNAPGSPKDYYFQEYVAPTRYIQVH